MLLSALRRVFTVLNLNFQMEEEEHTDRKQQLAMLYQKLSKIKKYLNDGNVIPCCPVTVPSI